MTGADAGTVRAVGFRSDRGPVLIALMSATAVVSLSVTIIAAAVPSIVRDLGDFSAFPWLFSVFVLGMAVTVPVYSKLADTVGRKPIILIGLALFSIGSVLCALAWDLPSLIAFRAIQGIGAGAIQPMAMTILGDTYSIEERGRVQGYISSMWAMAAVVGPTLGGLFAQFDAWRWIFIATLPLCVIAGILLTLKYHETFERRRHRIDVAGAVLVTLGATLVILGILEGGSAWEWWSPTGLLVLGGGAVLLGAFLLVERKAAEPILPLSLLRHRAIAASMVIQLLVGAVLTGLAVIMPTYLMIGAGVLPIIAGLAVAATSIGWPVASAVSGRIYLRRGFRFTTLLGGVLLLLAATALLIAAPWPSPYVVAGVGLVVGLGLGFCSVPSMVASQASVGWSERGVATGTLVFSRSIGQAVGSAVLGAVANGVIGARGGDDTDPATLVEATRAVLVVVVAIAAAILASAALMPARVRQPQG